MASYDSGVDSTTDDDDIVEPTFPDNRNMELVSSASIVMNEEPTLNLKFPMPLYHNSITEPMVYVRPRLDEMHSCKFELDNPPCTSTSTLDRVQTLLTPIQQYTEMLKIEKKDGSTQAKSNIGPCRVRLCHDYTRTKNVLHSDGDKNRPIEHHWFDQKPNRLSIVPYIDLDLKNLLRAVNLKSIEELGYLLRNGVNPNCCDSRKSTPLHLAASKGYDEAVGLLLKFGANPNIKDALGNNPLHVAVSADHVVVVTLLLKGGTDPSSCNVQGRSPLHLAQSKLGQLTRVKNDDSTVVKLKVLHIIDMLIVYFEKQKNSSDETELLNAFQTRLQISDTGEQINTGIQDLMNDLSTLRLSK